MANMAEEISSGTGFVEQFFPDIAKAAARLPSGADAYQLTAFDKQLKTANVASRAEYRQLINGIWIVVTEGMGMNYQTMPIRKIFVWPSDPLQGVDSYTYRLRRLINYARLRPVDSYISFIRRIHLTATDETYLAAYIPYAHELAHAALQPKLGRRLARNTFFSEGLAHMGETFLDSLQSGQTKPTHNTITQESYNQWVHFLFGEEPVIDEEGEPKNLPGWFFRFLLETRGARVSTRIDSCT